MKKYIYFARVAAMSMLLVLMLVSVQTASAQPTITPSTPSQDADGYYLIGNAAELYGFAKIVNEGTASANAKLTDNIVVNENVLDVYGNHNSGDFEEWIPIKCYNDNDDKYSVTFDGQGHTISGLYSTNRKYNAGFIGGVNGTVVVKNLGIVDSYFSGSSFLGSIVGFINGASSVILANVYSTSTVAGDNFLGGLVGRSTDFSSVTIINSYFAGKTSANSYYDDLVYFDDGELNVVNAFVLGTSQYGTSVTAEQLTDGTVAAALHYYQDALADGSMFGQKDGKTDFSGTLDGVSVTTADITLHTFDGNTTAYSSKYIVGNTTTLPVNVERDGYKFLGWYDNAGFEGDAVTQVSSSETGGKEYWAKFGKLRSVSFVLNGGEIINGEIGHYLEGETTVLPSFVTKSGSSFEGWYTTENFTGDRYYAIPATATEDMTFYAKWGAEKTTFYLEQSGRREPVNILYEGENLVWLDKTTGHEYFIKNHQDEFWHYGGELYDVPSSGKVGTFGDDASEVRVSKFGFYVLTLTDEGLWSVSVLRTMDNCIVNEIADQSYTGSAIEPEIEVKDGETTLTLGTDYTVVYSDNTNTGTATATITGIGNYSGTVEKSFEIVPKVTTLGALTLTEDQNGKTATIDGNYNEASVAYSLENAIEKVSVTFSRTFTAGATSTIVLPFGIDEGCYSGGDFFKFTDMDTKTWTATMSKVTSVKAHTPYLFVPSGETLTISQKVKLEATSSPAVTSDAQNGWKFIGVYQKKVWDGNDGDNKDYCFAANTTSDGVSPGDFVKIGTYVQVRAFRCYLTNSTLSKSNTDLPEKITIRLVDETSAVVTPDDPDPLNPDDSGDITTPVSEIAPNIGTKVWSYDRTIFIEAQSGTDYQIFDLSGRTLLSGATNSTREEITLGRATGIVIVKINGKSFKVNY